ncbi:MAG: response regulator [Longimicrobiales bacterium]|jgi:signal transduction histidine kinase
MTRKNMSPQDFETLIDGLFPFHFEVDYDLMITRVGPRLAERFESVAVGRPIAEVVKFQRPVMEWDLERVRSERGTLVVLKPLDGTIQFSGQFLDIESRSSLIFFGAPWISSVEEMEASKLELNDFPPNDPRGDLIMHAQSANMMMQDLSETNRRMVETEERNLAMQRQLDRLTHVEVAAQVSGGLAHKFNNLLAVLTAQLEMSAKLVRGGESESALSSLTRSLETSQEAAELVRELQSLGEDRKVEPEEVDLVDVVKRAQGLMRPVLGTGIDWVISAPDNKITRVVCDPRAIQDVLVSLAINASESMGGSGRITTTIRPLDWSQGPVGGFSDDPDTSLVSLLFTDEGEGFTAEARRRAFEPFYTTKGDSHSGLGLVMAERLVSLNGGQIRLVEKHSGGASVELILRAAAPDASSTDRLRVLLADDEEKVLELFSELLRSEGFEVFAYRSPTEALRDALAGKEFDLIVTDVRMPDLSGPELVRKIEEHCGTVPTVFASGFAEGAFTAADSPIDAMHAFVQKPFPIRSLIAAIEKVLDAASSAGALSR